VLRFVGFVAFKIKHTQFVMGMGMIMRFFANALQYPNRYLFLMGRDLLPGKFIYLIQSGHGVASCWAVL
jgi:hypothetical protein